VSGRSSARLDVPETNNDVENNKTEIILVRVTILEKLWISVL
jgi:hypothetical protein